VALMAGQPGRLQTTFNSLELGPRLHERSEIKYFQTGLARAENIEALPQGGFAVRQGLRHVGNLLSTAARLIDFRANDGRVFDVVYGAATAQAWGQTALAASFAHPYTEAQVRAIDWAQQLDTLVTFHPDVVPQRVLFNPAALTFANAAAPIVNLQNYDYGATYTNGVAAQWELEFIGVGAATVFVMTVNGQETEGILFTDITTARGRIETALTALGTIGPGFTVTVVSGKIRITFSGAENLGDKWAVSARAVNDADAAIVSFKRVTGVDPGEPVISATRGWPRCGVFYQQRLLMGGFKSLPAAWIASISGEYFNFDTRVKDANGAFLVLLDAPGGEEVRRIVNNQFLLVLTSGTNYWVAGSQDGLSKTTPPKHVPASDHGVAAGVPVVQNEGAAVYIHSSGDFVGELRYTDVDGNYKALDISLLAYHLISGATDIAVQKKQDQQAANTLAIVNGDGSLRLCMMLREQDITGFVRVESGCSFVSASCNGRNEMSVISERSGSRRLERFEPGLLLDAAVSFTNAPASATVTGLSHLNGVSVWALVDGHVFGPYTVTGGQITLPIPAASGTVGIWHPPVATTLPLPRERAEGVVVKRKGRIHTLKIDVEDTTSIAIQANGGKLYDIDLTRYGMVSTAPELMQGVTGTLTISGLTGWSDLPQITITQTRPGRLTVRSITTEARL
jgi:hypothetical protein